MELKKLSPIAATTLAAPQARSATTPKPATLNALDAFQAAKAPTFRKPDFSAVTAEIASPDWNSMELIYRVRSGDTLTGIARTLGTSIDTLQSWNFELSQHPDKLQVGQRIILPRSYHFVSAGETYSSIARKTGITPRALMTLNDAPSNGALTIGQEIKVPAAILSPEQAAMRAKLKDVMADSARAHGQIYAGANVNELFDSGDALGWNGDFEDGVNYEFSDDYDAVRVWHGEQDSPTRLTLRDPVKDVRNQVLTDALGSLTSMFAFQKWEAGGDDNVPPSEVVTTRLPDGRTQFVMEDPTQGPLTITYDPKAESVSLTGGNLTPWTGPATRAESTTLELGRRLGMRLPTWPADQILEEPGVQ